MEKRKQHEKLIYTTTSLKEAPPETTSLSSWQRWSPSTPSPYFQTTQWSKVKVGERGSGGMGQGGKGPGRGPRVMGPGSWPEGQKKLLPGR